MKNIINTIQNSFPVIIISVLSVIVFSMPTPASADIWSRLGNFFEDAGHDISDGAENVWDHIENEVEDWHIDINGYNDYGYYDGWYYYDDYCGYCGCNSTSTCGVWDSHNADVYGPNSSTSTYSGWNSHNADVYGPNDDNYNNYPQLNVSCSAGVSNTQVGGLVTWTANASGGNGYYTYYWSGDEGLYSNSQIAQKAYSYGGTKNANITVTSSGQSITRSCSTNVNQVLSYTQTNPYVSSVYLSEIPQTGVGDVMKITLFTLALILWSTIIAFALLKKKEAQEIPVVIASENVVAIEINKDTKEMSQIEDYARMNNVIISNEAVVNLLKAKRMNDIDIAETIRNIISSKTKVQGEWSTISESDLEGRV